MYTKKELKKIARFLEKEDVYILSDEIYSRITFGKNHVSMASFPEMREKTIVLSGMSKNYAMEGWRIGYALGKKELVDKINLVTSNTTSSPSTISQKASMGALCSPKDEVKKRTSCFKKRRDFLCAALVAKVPSLPFLKPDGAFYLFVNIQNHLGKNYHGKILWDSTAFAETLLENGVVTIPGVEFGAEGYLRISFAKDISQLEEAVNILAEMVKEMHWF